MSVYAPKLSQQKQNVQQGKLPNCNHPQPNHATFPPTSPSSHHYQADYKQGQPRPPPQQQYPPPHYYYPPPTWAEYPPHYQYPYHNNRYYDPSRSPERKKKSHKSEHKHKHRHCPNGHEKQREDESNLRSEREKQSSGIERKTNLQANAERDESRAGDSYEKPPYYPPPPYYNPYMYPPMMPPNMPPSHMYPYPPPMPYMLPGRYPYGEGQPMEGPPKSEEKETEKNEIFPSPTEIAAEGNRRPENERGAQGEVADQRPGENVYKMFPPPDHYMYGYPPPPMGYPGYPPPPYMMYPPFPYDPRTSYPQLQEQQRLASRFQVVNNKKQKIRKALKTLSNQQKEQMLETVSLISRFEQKVINQDTTYTKPEQAESNGLDSKYYQRSLMKVQKWLKSEEDRTREGMQQLIKIFDLKGMKQKITEAKNLIRAQSEDVGLQVRRSLSRLLKSPLQRVF